MAEWPQEIETEDGERFTFSAERPGWLVYENEQHVILVGRMEAFGLEVEKDNG